MKKLSSQCTKLLLGGIQGAGWLLIGMAVYIYLAEAKVVGTKEVMIALVTLLVAGTYWLVWAKPKLQTGQSWGASLPLLVIIVVSSVVEVTGDVKSPSPAWLRLTGGVAVGLGSIIVSSLLSARVQTEKEVVQH
jgi:hypothetical protein